MLRSTFSRLLTLALLWAPVLLTLTALYPLGEGPIASHLLAATGISLAGERALSIALRVPAADAEQGRYRIIPRHPWWGVWAAAIGLGVLGYGFWDASEGGVRFLTLLSLPAGIGCCVAGWRYRRQGIWGAWLELDDGYLRVRAPGRDYSVPIGQIQTVYRRARDGSFYIQTPWRERDTLVLTRAARGRFWVEGADHLLSEIHRAGGAVQEVASLWSATRRRKNRVSRT